MVQRIPYACVRCILIVRLLAGISVDHFSVPHASPAALPSHSMARFTREDRQIAGLVLRASAKRGAGVLKRRTPAPFSHWLGYGQSFTRRALKRPSASAGTLSRTVNDAKFRAK